MLDEVKPNAKIALGGPSSRSQMVFSERIALIVRFVQRRRRQIAIGASALAAMLVAVWWLAYPRGAPGPSRVDRAPVSTRSRGISMPAAAPSLVLEPQPAAKNDELCGYGPVPVVDGIPQIPPEVESAAESALRGLASALKASPAEADRATGTYLQMISAGMTASSDWRHAHGECPEDDTACQSAAAQAVSTATAGSLRALVRLATTTSDPGVYALAVYACRPIGDSSAPHCALLNYAQWARIEPDNAVPWLYLAREAEGRRDRSAFEVAVERASQSRYSDPYWDRISQLIGSDILAAQSSPVQVELAALLLGIQAAMPMPGPLGLKQYCSGADQANSRVETCTNLAAIFIEHGRTVLDVFLGGIIAERIGRFDPRLSALRDQVDAIKWQWSQELKGTQELPWFSCDSLQRVRGKAAAEAQVGESGLLRRELADAGITVPQAAERWRAELRKQLLKQPEHSEPVR